MAAQARREIETLGANSPYQHYLDHHLVQATNLYAEKAFAGERIIHSDCEPGVYFKQPFDLVALSAEAHQLVQSIQDSEFLTHENILENIPVRCYSTKDRDFIGICGVIYAEYKLKYGSPAVFYRDWNKPGKGLGYGIIQHKLPQNAKVALIGDWATGLDDTKELIKALLRLKLDAIIHLGDIY